MALVACKDCNKEFSMDTVRCPHCGANRPETIWSITKKVVGAALLAGIVLYYFKVPGFYKAQSVESQMSLDKIIPNTCPIENIELRQTSWHTLEFGQNVKVLGEIYNGCDDDAGVQIQVVFKDNNGHVVSADELWPASVRNIRSHDTYSYAITLQRPLVSADEKLKMSVHVLKTHRW
ncbi:MAG TPA: hypothetical protein VFT64_02285 [Rickettsiales bacterium]|nr:hypothetical protein [Rickettsiales bacterium]